MATNRAPFFDNTAVDAEFSPFFAREQVSPFECCVDWDIANCAAVLWVRADRTGQLQRNKVVSSVAAR